MAPTTTSPISARSASNRPARVVTPAGGRSAAFTVTELLVVIGIIALIAGILLPTVVSALRQSEASRTRADFQAISTGLDAYKQDFGTYPPVDRANTGSAVLVRALVAPFGDGKDAAGMFDAANPDPRVWAATDTYALGDVVRNGATLAADQYVALQMTNKALTAGLPYWAELGVGGANDGADGPEFRDRAGGRLRQGYLRADKIRTNGLAILSFDDKPILYFPARSGRTTVNTGNGYAGSDGNARYNVNDDWVYFRRPDDTAAFSASATETVDAAALRRAADRFQMMLGDVNCSGEIDAGETARASGQYLLWASGSDGLFGPPVIPGEFDPDAVPAGNGHDDGGNASAVEVALYRTAVQKSDDVTNFK